MGGNTLYTETKIHINLKMLRPKHKVCERDSSYFDYVRCTVPI